MDKMQSWCRKGIKKAKEKNNRDIRFQILVERINVWIYMLAAVSVISVMVLIIIILGLKGLDWIIASLSLLVLIESLFISNKEVNVYLEFIILLLIIMGNLVLIYFLGTNVDFLSYNEALSRFISGVCLIVSILERMIVVIKGIKKDSKNTVQKLERGFRK